MLETEEVVGVCDKAVKSVRSPEVCAGPGVTPGNLESGVETTPGRRLEKRVVGEAGKGVESVLKVRCVRVGVPGTMDAVATASMVVAKKGRK